MEAPIIDPVLAACLVPLATKGPAKGLLPEAERTQRPGRHAGSRWADLMRRAFGFDVPLCPQCGGRLRLIALIEDPRVIHRILTHLGLPTNLPEPRPARDPPVGSVVPPPADHVVPFDFGA